jgi:hypothetical protein
MQENMVSLEKRFKNMEKTEDPSTTVAGIFLNFASKLSPEHTSAKINLQNLSPRSFGFPYDRWR